MLPKQEFLGIPISRFSLAEMNVAIHRAIRDRIPSRVILALNAHTYAEARKNSRYLRALEEAFIVWPDGVPIVWAARLLGLPIGPRIHGHDLMMRLLREPISHYFYGSTPETLAAMKAALPGVRIAGMESPPFTRRAERADLSAINASGADILWVALGAPKQELWAQLNRDRIRVPIIACVGAAFEIVAGRFSRAPRLMQKCGLEWAWRLMQDPARLWRRYFATNGYFAASVLGGLIRAWTGNTRSSGAGPPRSASSP